MQKTQFQSRLNLPKIVDIHCIHKKLLVKSTKYYGTSSKNLSAKNDNKKDCHLTKSICKQLC